MKARTNLPQPHITKILKTLEARKLVKSVKNVNNPSRKVYMAYELEPSRELTGGAWPVVPSELAHLGDRVELGSVCPLGLLLCSCMAIDESGGFGS
eukprot:1159315-Pelagomonas_calceolata.AAC.7